MFSRLRAFQQQVQSGSVTVSGGSRCYSLTGVSGQGRSRAQGFSLGTIIPGQDANWQAIDESQSPNWQNIDDSQTPNWQEVA